MPVGKPSPYYFNNSDNPAGFLTVGTLYAPRLASMAGNGWFTISSATANPENPDALPGLFETELPGLNLYGLRNHLSFKQFKVLTAFDFGDAYFGAFRNAVSGATSTGLDNPDISLYDENNDENVGTSRSLETLTPQEIAVAMGPAAQSSRTAALAYDVLASQDREKANSANDFWAPDAFGAIYGIGHGFSLTAIEMPKLRDSFLAPASCTADEIARYQAEHGGDVPDATAGCVEIKEDGNFVGWANDDSDDPSDLPKQLQLPSNFRGLDYVGYGFMWQDAITNGILLSASLDGFAPGLGWGGLAVPLSSTIVVGARQNDPNDVIDVTFEWTDEGLDYAGALSPAVGTLEQEIGQFDGRSFPQILWTNAHGTAGTGFLLGTLSSMAGNRPATDNGTETTTDDVDGNGTNTTFTWGQFTGYGVTSFLGARAYGKIMRTGTPEQQVVATGSFVLGEAVQLGITGHQVFNGNTDALGPFMGGLLLSGTGAFIAPNGHWMDYTISHVSIASARPAGAAGMAVLTLSTGESGNGFLERGARLLLSGSRTAYQD